MAVPRSAPCRKCGYDLIGLAADGHCPQCGLPITGTYISDLDDVGVGPRKPCITCEYDLRGLSSQRNCPECGTPISKTDLMRAEAERRRSMWTARLPESDRRQGLALVALFAALLMNIVAGCTFGTSGLWCSLAALPIAACVGVMTLNRTDQETPGIVATIALWVAIQMTVNGMLLCLMHQIP